MRLNAGKYAAAHAAFAPDALHDRAESVLRRMLDGDPHNAKALMSLGDVHRAKGDLTAAAAAYRRANEQRPSWRKTIWMAAMLGGERLPQAPPRGVWPAPFARITNFLTPAEHDCVLRTALARGDSFTAGKVGLALERRVRTSRRMALVAGRRACEDLAVWFVPKVRAVLPSVLTRLRLDRADPSRIDLEMTLYPDGGYGKPHQDPSPAAYRVQTPIAIYYFHRQPRMFSGGDLLLYDTDVETRSFCRASFSRIEPAANTIVFYPRSYFHEIAPVQCPTGEFADGRFSLNCLWPRWSGEGHID